MNTGQTGWDFCSLDHRSLPVFKSRRPGDSSNIEQPNSPPCSPGRYPVAAEAAAAAARTAARRPEAEGTPPEAGTRALGTPAAGIPAADIPPSRIPPADTLEGEERRREAAGCNSSSCPASLEFVSGFSPGTERGLPSGLKAGFAGGARTEAKKRDMKTRRERERENRKGGEGRLS